jgi:hypothetical protein
LSSRGEGIYSDPESSDTPVHKRNAISTKLNSNFIGFTIYMVHIEESSQ